MKALIGALRVNLGMNSAQFRKGMSKAEISAQKFARNMKIAMAGATAAAAGAFIAIRGAAERADEAYKTAQSMGLPVEDLGRLQHAAEMSGASFQDLQTSLRKGSQSIVSAMRGMSSESTRALDDIGVSVKNADGTAKSITEVLGDVAEQFSQMPDGVKKTNAAMSIFGRSGTALIPMLNQGRDGLKEMGDEAERLGLVFDGNTGRASEVFNDNIARLSKTFTGFWNKVLAKVIPSLKVLTDRMVEASQQGGFLDQAVNGISGAMNIAAKAIALVFDNLKHLYDLFKIFVAAKIVGFLASAVGAFISLAKAIRVAGLSMLLLTKVSRAQITVVLLLAAGVAKATGKYEDLVGWLENMSSALMNALPESVRNGINAVSSEITGLGKAITDTDVATNTMLGRFEDSAERAASSFQDLGAKGKSAVDTIKDSTKDADSAVGKLGQAANSAFRSIGSSLRGLIDGSKNWLDVLSDIMMNLAQMAFSNINFGGGFGGIIGSLFSGLFGFAKGGTIMPGGTGGIDSQLVAFRKSPNERVDITKPGQQLTSGAGNVQIDQTFVLDGAIDGQRIQQMIQQGTAQSVEAVKRALPDWQVQQQTRGAIA